MRALMLRAPRELLDERHRRGEDRWDEVWEGVLHMVPPPSWTHQWLAGELFKTLAPHADARGLVLTYETGLYRSGDDYRVPDLVAAPLSSVAERGVDGPAALIVEILSPDDESYEKLDFYAAAGVEEAWMVDPGERTVELYVLRAGQMRLVQADERAVVRSDALGVTLETLEGPKLRVSWDGGHKDL